MSDVATAVVQNKGTSPLNPVHFRTGSKAKNRFCHFILNNGGVGDYLCYLQAVRFIASENQQIYGMVYCPDHVLELAEFLLQPWRPRFQVLNRAQLDANKERMKKEPVFSTEVRPINATGCHPLDLGFIYFCALNPPPAGWNVYPEIDYKEVADLVPDVPYAIMTPGATTENRTMRAETFNGIKDHLISKGVIPVFLGKKEVTDIRSIKYHEGYSFDGGVDLREQTSLLQATGLMAKAKLVVGLDNGLLHLACCTKVPVIFGYNIASPVHRRPRRPSGNIWEIYPDKQKLPCTFCQSDMRFMFDHDYAYCLYKDNLCLDALKDPKPWNDIIDKILG